MLRFTPNQSTGLSPFSVVTGRHPYLPSLPARPLPELPDEPTAEEEEAYHRVFAERARDLAEAGGRRMKDLERRIRDSTRVSEKTQESPTLLFHFMPGQLVTRRHRTFSKLDPRTTGPFRVRSVSGIYRQRVELEPIDGEDPTRKPRRNLNVHASQLVPYEKPYVEPEDIDVGPDATPDDPRSQNQSEDP